MNPFIFSIFSMKTDNNIGLLSDLRDFNYYNIYKLFDGHFVQSTSTHLKSEWISFNEIVQVDFKKGRKELKLPYKR